MVKVEKPGYNKFWVSMILSPLEKPKKRLKKEEEA